MTSWRRWFKRGAIVVVTAPVALALLGMSYQMLATRADRRNLPPPGRLIDVGGYRLHIQCEGAGHPTVVLETGALAMSALWGSVQPRVAVHTRVCSYDRAGLGWSEPGPEPRDGAQIAAELHTLLRGAGELPPYVLVGHSFGGLLVRVFIDQYPGDVAGLVLLDPSHPDQLERLRQVQGEPSLLDTLLDPPLPVLARLGVLRLGLRFSERFDGLGARRAAEFKVFFADASHQSAGDAEIQAWSQTAAQTRAANSLGELPLVVVSAAGADPRSPEQLVRLELHEELSILSSRGSHRILAGTTHGSLTTNRAHAAQVAVAIRELVDVTRRQ